MSWVGELDASEYRRVGLGFSAWTVRRTIRTSADFVSVLFAPDIVTSELVHRNRRVGGKWSLAEC